MYDEYDWDEERPAPRGRPALATFLSFVWPGLGQAYAGKGALALLFALPIVVLVGLAVYLFLEDRETVAFRMFAPGFALGITGVIVAAMLWRLLSMIHANLAAGGPRAWRPLPLAVLLVLSAVVVGAHLGVARLTYSFHEEAGNIFTARDPFSDRPVPTFAPDPGASGAPDASPIPGEPGASPLRSGSVEPIPTQEPPAETPLTGPPPSDGPQPVAPESNRLNILVAGLDSGPGRSHALTDTLIVVSVDRSTRDVAMVSFPRDIASFPLSDGRTYRGKINSLLTYARQNPEQFPEPPMQTLARETGHLLGIRVDHYAAIDLHGFERLIDTVGGVTVHNDRVIDDPSMNFYLAPGSHTLNGADALMYVRSRKGVGDSDFSRAARQQDILIGLRGKLTDLSVLPRLPEILDALAGTITTNYPPELLTETMELGRGVSDDRIRQYVLGPPYSWHPPTSETGGSWELRLDLDRVAALSIDLFGDDSRYTRTGAP